YNTQNGAPLTYYVTGEDITFIHDVPNDTWTVGVVEHTVTYTVDGTTHHTETVASGSTATAPTAPTKAEDEGYTYTFDCWTLNGVEYDFSTAVTSDITLVAKFTATPKENTVDITAGLNFADQGDTLKAGTDTYLITTSGLAWTNTGTGRVNLDYEEQLKNIYFNGRPIADINAESDDAYGSNFETITGDANCAPIAVLYNKLNDTSSYLQIWVPTGYPNLGATAEQNHQSIEIKAGFSITQGSTTWVVSEDIKWINLNGSWVNAKTTFAADTVTIGNPRVDGAAKELYKVDITSESWNITCNNYDFMYDGYATHRRYIFINGVSVYDINTNTDDSGYVYSSSPMTGNNDTLFAHPILIETHNQGGDPRTITLWIHKNYIESLGDEITITLGAGFNAFTGGLSLVEDVNYSMVVTVTVDDGTYLTTHKVIKGNTIAKPANPTKEMTATAIYTFDNWYIQDTDTVFDFTAVITEDVQIEARFTENSVDLRETEVVGIKHYLKTSDDNWLAFELTVHDYVGAEENFSMDGYAELLRIGFLDKVVLKGAIKLNNGTTVEEATLMDVYNSYGTQQGPLLNFWGLSQFAMRLPVGDGVEEIIIQDGCCFPSYQYFTTGASMTDTRYMVKGDATYKYDESIGAFVKQAALSLDIKMADGASVRITSDLATSGLRFETLISTNAVE
ncbi:MAG: InlB B-repeat-containing protein, partial [Clostridia bacterium]|nr:InlB B-repeat-containing protein [Clostridia bacterium]